MARVKRIGLAVLAFLALGAVATTAAVGVEGLLPMVKKNITFLGKKTVIETTGKNKITCGTLSGTGEFTNESHGKATLDLNECEALGFAADSLGDEKALILVPVLFLLCLVNSSSLLFGLWLELTSSVHVDIPFGGKLFVITGSNIGHILTNATSKLYVVDLTQTAAGVPSVKECKDEAGNVKTAQLLVKIDTEASVAAATQTTEGLVEFEEAMSLMDK